MTRPRLSLCMIVRNEESMLPEFLAAIDGLWDELVVADTGSEDGTVALLRRAGARIVDFPWCDDFAAARNASLQPAGGDWILFLDADERVTPDLKREIDGLLWDPDAGAATLVMRNELPGGLHRESRLLRLFRNDPAIRFRHRIHEDVAVAVGAYLQRTGLALRHLAGTVDHLGYVREVAASRHKKDRDLTLLRRSVAEDPDDLYCWFKMLELARFWDDQSLWRSLAVDVAERIAARPTARLQREAWSGELAALVSQGLPGGPADHLAWLDANRHSVTCDAAWHLRYGLLAETLGRTELAAASFQTCLETVGGPLDHLTGVRPRLGLCRLAAAAGDVTAAHGHALLAATAGPRDPEALLAAVTFVPLIAGAAALDAFAVSHADTHPDAAPDLAAVLLKEGHPGPAATVLAAAAAEDPGCALGQLVCSLVLDEPVDLNLELSPEEAAAALRHWVRILWDSRRTEHMTAFADACGVLAEPFPWLAAYLAEETRRLSGG